MHTMNAFYQNPLLDAAGDVGLSPYGNGKVFIKFMNISYSPSEPNPTYQTILRYNSNIETPYYLAVESHMGRDELHFRKMTEVSLAFANDVYSSGVYYGWGIGIEVNTTLNEVRIKKSRYGGDSRTGKYDGDVWFFIFPNAST